MDCDLVDACRLDAGRNRTVGRRWIVEATNTWWTNYGQLRRNTDRKRAHRHAALCLATATLVLGRLLRLAATPAT